MKSPTSADPISPTSTKGYYRVRNLDVEITLDEEEDDDDDGINVVTSPRPNFMPSYENPNNTSTSGVVPSLTSTTPSSSTTNDLEAILSQAILSSTGRKSEYQQIQQQDDTNTTTAVNTNAATTPTTTTSSKLHNRSRSNSWDNVNHANDNHHDDLFLAEAEEDDAVVRRYHMRNRIPIVPAEFATPPWHLRLWLAWQELRTAARQRRAARLLNDNTATTAHCLQTWCCDATDRGIALVAILLLLWIVIGFISSQGSSYWFFGFLLFVIRVTARCSYEYYYSLKSRKRSSTNNNNTSTNNTSISPGTTTTTVEMNDYRDHA